MPLLDGGRELAEVTSKNGRLGSLLQRVIDGVNGLAKNVAADPVGQTSPPNPPNAVAVKSSGEMVHIAINHTGELSRGVKYFSEISTNPSFSQPLIVDHGASRTSHPITLPTHDDDGNLHSYYIRSFAQYPGSAPSAPTTYGGANSPTPVNLSGTTRMTPLPSTGSGTGPNSGQSSGQGSGKFPKRNDK